MSGWPESGGVDLFSWDRFDWVCNSFEEALDAGQPVKVEDFLSKDPSINPDYLLPHLLAVEIDHRRRQGENPSAGEYLARFPGHSVIVKEIFYANRADRDTDQPENTHGGQVACAPTVVRSETVQIGHYELIEEIGSGGFGEVWRALDARLRRVVAIKMLSSENSTKSNEERFRREAHSAARLRHPQIVSIHDVGSDNGRSYLVTDYIEGINLKQRLETKRYSPREAAEMCRTIADAVHFAHEHGIVHRDLKPSNILLDSAERPHVADFGLARLEASDSSLTMEGAIVGTPKYMSPEQAAGKGFQADRRSDVYSLGVMLYELLTGETPFDGEYSVLLHQIRHDEPRAPRSIASTIPRDLETICLKAIEKESTNRYQTAGELAADLERWLQGEPILARRASLAERSVRWTRRNFVTTAAAAAGACAVAPLILLARPASNRRQVSITTSPVGADVYFVPLHESTGEPQPQLIEHAGKTKDGRPVVPSLVPGEYLVVAVLPDGRFHEVFRRVPPAEEQLPHGVRHRLWVTDGHRIKLLPVAVPEASVTDGMALQNANDSFFMGSAHDASLPRHRRSIPGFFIDAARLKVREAKLAVGGELPMKTLLKLTRSQALPGDDADTVLTWDDAVYMAELLGKRLPDEAEWECAALRNLGTPAEGRAEQRATAIDGMGLAQEWTSNWGVSADESSHRIPARARRIIRSADPGMLRARQASMIGGTSCASLRCARSLKPRLEVNDFVRVVDSRLAFAGPGIVRQS